MTLTDTKLRNLRPTGKRFEIPDREGLVLRVSQRGTMTWTVTYRVRGAGDIAGTRVGKFAGAKQRFTIGEYPGISLAEAREKTASVKRLARAGADPIDEFQKRRTRNPTVETLIERFTKEHLHRNLKGGRSVELLLRRHVLPMWKDRALSSITRSDVLALLEIVRSPHPIELAVPGKKPHHIIRGGPGSAAEVRKWCRAMFQFGVDSQMVSEDPFAAVRNRDRLRKRDRVLSMEELRDVWNATGLLGYPWGPFFQLIMITGDRRGEWANARMEWLDHELTMLTIPAAHYKTERVHVVPLSAQAREIIRGLPKLDFGPFIFSSTGGTRPISGFSKAKARLDGVCGSALSAWTIHDLRRSMATHMERIGVEPHIIEICLGHSLRGIAATYRRYSYLPEKADALQKWADELYPRDPQ